MAPRAGAELRRTRRWIGALVTASVVMGGCAARASEPSQVKPAALQTAQRDAELLAREAGILWRQGRRDESLKRLERARQLHPGSPAILNNLAAGLAASGLIDEAQAVLETALSADPAYATVYNNIGLIYAHLARQAYRKALEPEGRDPADITGLRLAWIDTERRPDAPVMAQAPAAPPTSAVAPQASSRPVTAPAPAPIPSSPAASPPPSPPPAPSAAVRRPETAASTSQPTRPAAPANAPAATAVPSAPPVAPPMAPPRASRPAQAPAAAPSTGRTGAVAATAAPAARPANPTPLATEALTRWAQAWADKDMKAYVNAYVPGFKGSLGSHAAWRSQREARIVPRDRIEVRVSEIKAQWEGERIEATFRQQYESGNLNVRSRRTVVLEQVEGRWLIREESGR